MSERWDYTRPTPTPGRACKNAGEDAPHRKRPAPHPGPRCTTCHRAELKRRREASAASRRQGVYGVTPEAYEALREAQGGRCAICRRATGASKRLAVDHDHLCMEEHPAKQGCTRCVRGLLCSPCNRMLGHLRDDVNAFRRAIAYLMSRPLRDRPVVD